MVRSKYKHFNREFRTKFKLFTFSLVERGSVVKITEWRNTTSFSVNLDLGGVAWIKDVLISVMRQEPIEDFNGFTEPITIE